MATTGVATDVAVTTIGAMATDAVVTTIGAVATDVVVTTIGAMATTGGYNNFGFGNNSWFY